jgi:mRNA-degrading endonuclease RelE of RelBE toxin-antitoxin system
MLYASFCSEHTPQRALNPGQTLFTFCPFLQFDNADSLATILAMSEIYRFEIIVDDAVRTHFAAIERIEHSAILDAIELHLRFEAAVRARNRKPLRIPNRLNATWELRCGTNNRYRVFYDVDVESLFVLVLAVGRKSGNRLLIGHEEFEL